MTATMHKAHDYREFGVYDRFKSRRVGHLFRAPRYFGKGTPRSRLVPLLAYQTRAFRDGVHV